MGIKYYKKLSPTTKVALSNGSSVQFTTLDSVLGYFATDVQYVQEEFEKAMREERYGITEISGEEFTRDYVDKKKSGVISRPLWRDELTRGRLMPSASTLKERLDAVAGVVGVEGPKAVRAATVPVVVSDMSREIANRLTPVMKTPAAKFVPTVAKRRVKDNADKPVTA